MTERSAIFRAISAGRCGECGKIAWDGYVPSDCPNYTAADYTWGCFYRPATDEEKADAVMHSLGESTPPETKP